MSPAHRASSAGGTCATDLTRAARPAPVVDNQVTARAWPTSRERAAGRQGRIRIFCARRDSKGGRYCPSASRMRRRDPTFHVERWRTSFAHSPRRARWPPGFIGESAFHVPLTSRSAGGDPRLQPRFSQTLPHRRWSSVSPVIETPRESRYCRTCAEGAESSGQDRSSCTGALRCWRRQTSSQRVSRETFSFQAQQEHSELLLGPAQRYGSPHRPGPTIPNQPAGTA